MIVINTIRLCKVYLWPGFGLFKAFNPLSAKTVEPVLETNLSVPKPLNNVLAYFFPILINGDTVVYRL
jgi:hypothetical protein